MKLHIYPCIVLTLFTTAFFACNDDDAPRKSTSTNTGMTSHSETLPGDVGVDVEESDTGADVEVDVPQDVSPELVWEPERTRHEVITINDLEDPPEPIPLYVEVFHDTSPSTLQARVCKAANSTFINDGIHVSLVHIDAEDPERNVVLFEGTMAGPGQNCTDPNPLLLPDGEDQLNLHVWIIAPDRCLEQWDRDCTSDGCGYCWSDAFDGPSKMPRTP